jgi:transcriptional regulator with XRE-family HTH domain
MTSPLPGRLEAWCLSARLHLLYKALVDPVTNRPHTLRGTIKAMQLRFGPEYAPSTGFLSDLVAGRRDNPSAKTLWALAEFFGVPMEYFTGQPTAAVVDQILRQTLDHPVVREVALGVATLPAASQEAVLRLVQGLANSEGVRAEDE